MGNVAEILICFLHSNAKVHLLLRSATNICLGIGIRKERRKSPFNKYKRVYVELRAISWHLYDDKTGLFLSIWGCVIDVNYFFPPTTIIIPVFKRKSEGQTLRNLFSSF